MSPSIKDLVNEDEIRELREKEGETDREIDSLVEEKMKEKKEELQRREEQLNRREGKLEKERETLDEKAKLKTEEHFEDERAALQKKEEKLDRREAQLAGVEERLQRFEEEGGPEFMEILRSSTEEEREERSSPESEPPPSEFWTDLSEDLEESGYEIHHDLLPLQFVLSATVAAATGQFVVLSGPTGVGKTSLVKKMRQGLGIGPDPDSGKSGVIPVRPSWIDSTDLLGFYNPAEDVYEPTPFMDELLEARRYGEAGEHYFLVLDEMNLSRIENYGADFLAKMEKAREVGVEEGAGAKLHLYSKSITDRKRRKINSIIDNGEEEQKEEELAELRTQLDRYPARFPIPDGLVLFGTINADETTHPFSPKFKDRAFVIQLPPATLSEDLSSNQEGEPMEKVWTLTQEFVRDISPQREFSDEVVRIWKDIAYWNSEHLRPMGIHLSHRLEHLFRYYFAAAEAFGITPDAGDSTPYSLENVASTFARSKILPWVSFHRDDKAVSENHEHKREVLEDWAEDLEEREEDDGAMTYFALKEAIEDTLRSGNLTYEYMGS